MNIAFIGLGGVGGYYGARMAQLAKQKEELNVYFIARNKHLDSSSYMRNYLPHLEQISKAIKYNHYKYG